MAYKKCEFKDGETVITAECMNAMQDAICQLETDRENHNKANNPHNLDAESVGARPNTWTPSAEEVGARPSNWTPTAEDVGAAPSGYGLGGQATFIPASTELASVTETGFYFWSDISTASDKPFLAGDLFVIKRTDSIIDQIAFGQDSLDHQIRIRKVVNGVGTEWEWVNPPMYEGVEYRTAERYKGKAVYSITFPIGALPNEGVSSYTLPASTGGLTGIVSATLTNQAGILLNLIDSVNVGAMWVKSEGDYSAHTGIVTLKYVR